MTILPIEDSIILCYFSLVKLSNWLNNNNLWEEVASEKNLLLREKWKKELDNDPLSFFTDSELLLLKDDAIFLQLENKNHSEFLLKTYNFEKQKFCQKVLGESKNIVLLAKSEWKKLEKCRESRENISQEENCLILFKNEEISKESLKKWLRSL